MSVDTPLTEFQFYAIHQDSSGSNSSIGVSTPSSARVGATQAINTTGVIEITRECAIQV